MLHDEAPSLRDNSDDSDQDADGPCSTHDGYSADEHMQEPLEASDDDTDEELIPDANGWSVLHLCSGPDREGAYSRWLQRARATCLN